MRSARNSKLVGAVLALTAVVGLAACGHKTTAVPSTATSTSVTTAAPAGAAAGSDSNAAIDQQIQNLNQGLNQVNGDLSSADKAIANGG